MWNLMMMRMMKSMMREFKKKVGGLKEPPYL